MNTPVLTAEYIQSIQRHALRIANSSEFRSLEDEEFANEVYDLLKRDYPSLSEDHISDLIHLGLSERHKNL